MRIILLAALLCFSAPAWAADGDHTIKIIHDDGSVDVIDLRRKAPPAAEPAPTPARQQVAPASPKQAAPAKAAPVKKKVAKRKALPGVPARPGTPIPARKPRHFNTYAPSALPVEAAEAPEDGAPAVQYISRNYALAAALDHAPPARDVEVYKTTNNGQPAVSVLFRTEEGFYEVLLDAVNGDVLDTRGRPDISTQPRPGFLPPLLR